ncbi:MAG: HNH endonuclease [Promethearchaeota archaeon]
MIKQGDVIPYIDMCKEEGVNLQRGMNFRLKGGFTVILMSIRPRAPYADRVEEEGKILIYEGHDIPSRKGGPNPKMVDQPKENPSGNITQNGLFYKAAKEYKINKKNVEPEFVKVYEKIRSGIWVYNGIFKLVDAWQERINTRKVFKFKLELLNDEVNIINGRQYGIEHNRIIPTAVKLEVWKRDKGRCVKCGSQDNLHFDHIIPYSKGGSSLVAENIQILCAKHNLEKRDKIE